MSVSVGAGRKDTMNSISAFKELMIQLERKRQTQIKIMIEKEYENYEGETAKGSTLLRGVR